MTLINWKKNYIIKSFISRPVLFTLVACIASLLTFMVMDKYTEIESERLVKEYYTEILTLRTEVIQLTREKSKLNQVIEEEFDEETGKLIKKKTSTQSESESDSSTQSSTIQEKIAKQAKELYEKESLSRATHNYIFVGYSPNYRYVGYTRSWWIFEAGFLVESNNMFNEYSAAGIIGVRF